MESYSANRTPIPSPPKESKKMEPFPCSTGFILEGGGFHVLHPLGGLGVAPTAIFSRIHSPTHFGLRTHCAASGGMDSWGAGL